MAVDLSKKPKTEEQRAQLLKEAEEEAKQLVAQIDAYYATQVYWRYVQFVHEGLWKPARFLIYICDVVERLLEDDEHIGAIFQLPPQHGKSMTITETLPSYYLGKHPDKHVIEVSYNDDFAAKFGRTNKQKIELFGKALFGIELSKDSQSASEFEIAGHRGGMISRGIGATITGNSGDLIIIDDPVKNRQDADSKVYSEFVINEWLSTVRTRRSATGKFILIQTRWAENDLAGYLQKYEPEDWIVVSFPAIAEKDEPEIGRKAGEALFPEIGKDLKWLERERRSYLETPLKGGRRAWMSQYQQRASSVEGNMIKRAYWQRYKLGLDMRFDELIQSWDCSFKDTDGSDNVAGHVWGRIGANYYLVDRIAYIMDILKTMENITIMSKKWRMAIIKLIEDKANGSAVITMLRNKLSGIIPVNAIRSKAERVNAILPLFEAGNVYIPEEIEISPGVWQRCEWAEEVIDECADFRPEKQNQVDDDVDAMSQALNRLMYSYVPTVQDIKVVNGFVTEEEAEDMGIRYTKPVLKVSKTTDYRTRLRNNAKVIDFRR